MTKRPEEILLLTESGRLLASVFEMLDNISLIGTSTLQVNELVEKFITDELQSRAASKGQYGYEFSINSSVNNVACHGVPSSSDILKDGDIVNFDITLEKNGYIADSSKTYLVGNVKPATARLVRVAHEAMWAGIREVRPGARLGDIGAAIERHVKRNGYSIVRDYCGHGIGREMHEEPQILHFGKPGTGLTIREGMVFTIEPIVNQGRRNVKTEPDGWTVVTKDGSLSAQFEHTVAVTASGVSVLTLRSDELSLVKKCKSAA